MKNINNKKYNYENKLKFYIYKKINKYKIFFF